MPSRGLLYSSIGFFREHFWHGTENTKKIAHYRNLEVILSFSLSTEKKVVCACMCLSVLAAIVQNK